MKINATNIPLKDRGMYYRGLLVLIRRDQTIDAQERGLMIQIGEALDFDRRFCEAAIDDLMKNPHIKAEPVQFPDRKTAEAFINDALALALVDGNIHPKELSWVKAVAEANGISGKYLSKKMEKAARLVAKT
jgi:hypothetical protein